MAQKGNREPREWEFLANFDTKKGAEDLAIDKTTYFSLKAKSYAKYFKLCHKMQK
jgi:hypothetical protein